MTISGIKNWPESERPREILLKEGPHKLSDAGLIAVLLRSGRRGEDAVSLSRQLIKKFGGLGPLLHASKSELKGIKGLGPAKIAVLMAAMEIAKRKSEESLIGKDSLHSSEDVYELLRKSMMGLKDEVFKVVFLDNANRVLAVEDLFKGTVDRAHVYPREVIRRAIEIGATGLILVHNHPSEQANPSADDRKLCRALRRACEAVELRVLDQIVVTNNGFCRIKE